ncbi:hypothetical protein HYT23_04510 [Candidatus Pacearchaeota archaeon]|nr:hypothetical protein [Candidatus Pacearchaeota archaeon]
MRATLEREQRFGMGKPLDGLAVISYLHLKELISKREFTKEPFNNTERFSLNCGGDISLIASPRLNLLQVVLSAGVPVPVAEDLEIMGMASREQSNFEKYGIRGIY